MTDDLPGSDIVVVIPFKGEVDMTLGLLDQIADDSWDFIILIDNGSTHAELDQMSKAIESDSRISLYSIPDRVGIYALWNLGIRIALAIAHQPHIAILNNDITVPAFFLTSLSSVLDRYESVGISYPDYDKAVGTSDWYGDLRETYGTKQHGGMCGHAFMLRGNLMLDGLPYLDENLKWWYGDDLMERNVRAFGYSVVRLEGLPCDHINEHTANKPENAWTHEQKVRDTEYWHATYG